MLIEGGDRYRQGAGGPRDPLLPGRGATARRTSQLRRDSRSTWSRTNVGHHVRGAYTDARGTSARKRGAAKLPDRPGRGRCALAERPGDPAALPPGLLNSRPLGGRKEERADFPASSPPPTQTCSNRSQARAFRMESCTTGCRSSLCVYLRCASGRAIRSCSPNTSCASPVQRYRCSERASNSRAHKKKKRAPRPGQCPRAREHHSTSGPAQRYPGPYSLRLPAEWSRMWPARARWHGREADGCRLPGSQGTSRRQLPSGADIAELLSLTRGNISQAARVSGKRSAAAFGKVVKKYGLERIAFLRDSSQQN